MRLTGAMMCLCRLKRFRAATLRNLAIPRLPSALGSECSGSDGWPLGVLGRESQNVLDTQGADILYRCIFGVLTQFRLFPPVLFQELVILLRFIAQDICSTIMADLLQDVREDGLGTLLPWEASLPRMTNVAPCNVDGIVFGEGNAIRELSLPDYFRQNLR